MKQTKKKSFDVSNNAQAQTMKEAIDLADISTYELALLCRDRAKIYNMMAGLCRAEVSKEKYTELMESLYPISTDNENINKSSHLIARYLSRKSEGVTEELAADYAATFIGRGSNGHSAAYPFESTYTASKRLLMQGARDEVLAIYRSQGLDKCETWKNTEDHISVELEFMERMCKRSANAFEQGNVDAAAQLFCVQYNFLCDHLNAWVPMMSSEMRAFAQTDFYLGLSYMLLGYIQFDVEFFEDILSECASAQEMSESNGQESLDKEISQTDEASVRTSNDIEKTTSENFKISFGFDDDYID